MLVRASTLFMRKVMVGTLGRGAPDDLLSTTLGAFLRFFLGNLRGALVVVSTGTFGRVAFRMNPFPLPLLGKSIPTSVWERLALAVWKDEVEDVLPESVEAGRLLGPPMSMGGLLMPMAPVVGLHGGAALILALVSGGLVLAMDLRLSPSLMPKLASGGNEASGVMTKVWVSSPSRSSWVKERSPSRLYGELVAL
jgi:hypothetical protein